MPDTHPEWITSVQAAKLLGISRTRVGILIRDGRLPAQKVGRDWMILPEDVENFVRKPQGNFRLSPQQISEIQARAKQGDSVTTLAEAYGVSEQTIYRHLRAVKSTGDSGA